MAPAVTAAGFREGAVTLAVMASVGIGSPETRHAPSGLAYPPE